MRQNIEVRVTKNFARDAKPLLKKYPSLDKELRFLYTELKKNPELGQPLGNNAYKIRLSIKSKGKGKSGGARVITYLEAEMIGYFEKHKAQNITVNLISIYDTSEISSISIKEIKELIQKIEQIN